MASMAYNSAAGLGGMLKSGHEHYHDDNDGSGAVIARSIAAACELTRMVRSSLGPQGRCKLLVNHLEKMTVTSDCAAILKEIDVEHPAATLLERAVHQQEVECGDATNLTLLFAGDLLQNTLDLMRTMGGWKHATDILEGYQLAADKLLEDLLPKQCVAHTVGHPVTDKEGLHLVLKPVLGSKQYTGTGSTTTSTLVDLVAQACQIVMEDETKVLSPDAIRTVKILGGHVGQSACIEGFVSQRGVETTLTFAKDKPKIAIFATGMEASSTEAKGTVLMKTAADLMQYNKTEEAKMKDIIQGIAESGVKVVVSGGNISDMALHFLEQFKLVALKVSSKWELRRLCQACGATALVRLGTPTPDEMGVATQVEQRSVGGRTVTVFENDGDSKIATLVLRAATTSVLNDLERAVDDGVHAVQMACKDGRLVYGGGACEMECAVQLDQFADQHPGLEQYAIRAFAKSLECVARTLADNAGWDALQVVADMRAAHSGQGKDVGVDIDDEATPCSMKTKQIYDLMRTKQSALKLSIEAAMTVLKIDQIIMSKKAGGPNMSQMPPGR